MDIGDTSLAGLADPLDGYEEAAVAAFAGGNSSGFGEDYTVGFPEFVDGHEAPQLERMYLL